MDNELTISVPEAAKMLGVSKPTMYVLARRADFPSFSVGNRIVVHKQLFEAWVKAQAENRTEVVTH